MQDLGLWSRHNNCITKHWHCRVHCGFINKHNWESWSLHLHTSTDTNNLRAIDISPVQITTYIIALFHNGLCKKNIIETKRSGCPPIIDCWPSSICSLSSTSLLIHLSKYGCQHPDFSAKVKWSCLHHSIPQFCLLFYHQPEQSCLAQQQLGNSSSIPTTYSNMYFWYHCLHLAMHILSMAHVRSNGQ